MRVEVGGHRPAVQVALDPGEAAGAEQSERLGQGRRWMADVLPDREGDDAVEAVVVEQLRGGQVAELVVRSRVGECLPSTALHDIHAVRVRAEMMAQVPDLVAGSTTDLQDALVGQVDLPVDLEQSCAGAFRPHRSRGSRRDRHERVGQVLGMELLHELDIEGRLGRDGRADLGHDPAGLADLRGRRPATADRPRRTCRRVATGDVRVDRRREASLRPRRAKRSARDGGPHPTRRAGGGRPHRRPAPAGATERAGAAGSQVRRLASPRLPPSRSGASRPPSPPRVRSARPGGAAGCGPGTSRR